MFAKGSLIFVRYIENLFSFLSLILNLPILCKIVFDFFSHLVNKTKKGKNTSTKKSVIKISPLAPACKLLNMQCIQEVRCQIRCRTACDFCHT